MKTTAPKQNGIPDSEISLRSFRKKDHILIKKWYKDPQVIRYILPEKENRSLLERFIHKYFKSWIINRLFRYWLEHGRGFTINYREQPIGVIVCWLIDPECGTYRLPVTIGLPEYWGKGYGRKAIRLAADFIFEKLDGQKIIAGDIHKDNIRSLRMYESCGFKILSTEEADRYRQLSIPAESKARSCDENVAGRSGGTVSLILKREDHQGRN